MNADSCAREHRFREIQSRDACCLSCQPFRVAASATANLNNVTPVNPQIHLSQDLSGQLTRAVGIAVVRFGPLIVGRRDCGFLYTVIHSASISAKARSLKVPSVLDYL